MFACFRGVQRVYVLARIGLGFVCIIVACLLLLSAASVGNWISAAACSAMAIIDGSWLQGLSGSGFTSANISRRSRGGLKVEVALYRWQCFAECVGCG